jgi:hypothetical protein
MMKRRGQRRWAVRPTSLSRLHKINGKILQMPPRRCTSRLSRTKTALTSHSKRGTDAVVPSAGAAPTGRTVVTVMADVRVLSRRRRRLSVDGLHTRRGRLRCVPFCSSRVAISHLIFRIAS